MLLTGQADVLELKSGAVLNGSFVGGTASTVRFETSSGLQVFATTDILAITFTGESASGPISTVYAEPAAPPAKPASVSVPAGTMLMVRTSQPISTSSVRTGDRFSCKLDADLVVNGVVVAPRNTPVYGSVIAAQAARRVMGQSILEITLSELSINGELQPIQTNSWSSEAARSGGKAVRGALAGAAIGGIADGSDGAQTGAAIGATAGALKKGDAVSIPQNQLLEFQISMPTEIKVSQ
ncbi:MAG: hypothetical protein DRP71_10785 [Verrucomicrobia bacterium]|nr:MAG: hypothetical protein DRP71_10785 [Verrucomicrobiota bacterium]